MLRIKHLTPFFLAAVICAFLISCNANGVRPLNSQPTGQDPDPQTDPLVQITFDGFDPETTTLRFGEGQTVEFELDTFQSTITTASLRQISGPTADFGEMTAHGITTAGNLAVGDGVDDIQFTLQDVEGSRQAIFDRGHDVRVKFVMPSVTTRTTMTFQFRSNSTTQSRVRSIQIIIEDDAGAMTLTGKVSKGLVSNTKVRLYSVDGFIDDFINSRQVVDPVQIDATGTYTFTILPATDFEELLLYRIEADGADMVCDAPQGCPEAAFGDSFEVDKDLDLRAYIRPPQLGTTQNVNINILTTLTAKAAQKIRIGFERVDPGDVAKARNETAGVFGLANQEFSRVPFVDVTLPVTSIDENAVRVAMIGGGVLGAALSHSDPTDEDEFLEQIQDFIDEYEDARAPCRNAAGQEIFSIEDIMFYSLQLAQINGSAATQNFFAGRLNGIRNGTITCQYEPRAPE